MSDFPDNQKRDESDFPENESDGPPTPEQIWPPPDEAPDESSESIPPETAEEPTELDSTDEIAKEAQHGTSEDPNTVPSDEDPSLDDDAWTDKVDEIDQAIKEIRGINGNGVETASEAKSETLVAGSVEPDEKPLPPTGSSSGTVCEVREKSVDELGRLWGNIFFSPEHQDPKAIVVTTARSGDGATQIAMSLAMVGAEANREPRIALVDFNFRNPQIADLLEIESSPGLTDVLEGRCSIEEAMRTVTLKNGNDLYVLPSGPAAEHPLGLIKSRQVQAFVARIRERYDQTIIDVASANSYPDAQVIGSLVDGAVIVIRAGDTPRETVAEAKKRLDLAGARCLGLVLNQRSDPIPDLFYRNI